jgi:hypothetical protein
LFGKISSFLSKRLVLENLPLLFLVAFKPKKNLDRRVACMVYWSRIEKEVAMSEYQIRCVDGRVTTVVMTTCQKCEEMLIALDGMEPGGVRNCTIANLERHLHFQHGMGYTVEEV